MKRNMMYVVLAILLGCTTTVFAQENDGQRKNRSKDERIERQTQALIHALQLDETKATQFRDIYKNYRKELDEAIQKPEEWKQLAATKGQKQQGKTELTDEQKDKLMQFRFERAQKRLDIKEKYYTEFRKFLSPKQVERIYADKGHTRDNRHMKGGPKHGKRGHGHRASSHRHTQKA